MISSGNMLLEISKMMKLLNTSFFSPSKMTINGRTILVVAGGYNSEYFDSVEILDPSENNVWTQGLW